MFYIYDQEGEEISSQVGRHGRRWSRVAQPAWSKVYSRGAKKNGAQNLENGGENNVEKR